MTLSMANAPRTGPRCAGSDVNSPLPALRQDASAPARASEAPSLPPVASLGQAEGTAQRVLEAMATGFVALAPDWTITYVNAAAEVILGRGREHLLGRNLWEEFPGAEELEFGRQYHQAMATGQPIAFDAFYPGLGVWFEIRAVRSPEGLGVYFHDITALRAQQVATEEAAARATLLAEVSRELAETIDGQEAVARLAELMVPALADWCVITVVDDDGTLRDLAYTHRDPARAGALYAYAEMQLPEMTDAAPIWQVLTTGRPVVAPTIREHVLQAVFPNPAARALLAALNPTSGTAVPISARGRALGVISLWVSGDRDPHSVEEVGLALDIGRRAGLALDNARLYARERSLSETLQRSLLTAPPEPDHCQIVVRYQPAAHEAQVGGDWYDAFLQPDGATVVVIGDVVGHDTYAAAAMGQLRGLLRGIAYSHGEGPAATLTRVDRAIEGLMLDTMATAVVLRLEQDDDQAERAVTSLRWSNAGHLPALLVTRDGQVSVLDTDQNLMLGVDPTTTRTETVTEVERGLTVLLYTDGLVERRGSHLDDGIAYLTNVVAELAHLPLNELCDQLLHRLLPQDNEDDVALIAVRLHPQDRPRPPGAGPRRIPDSVVPEG